MGLKACELERLELVIIAGLLLNIQSSRVQVEFSWYANLIPKEAGQICSFRHQAYSLSID